jgi:hypothetical protein
VSVVQKGVYNRLDLQQLNVGPFKVKMVALHIRFNPRLLQTEGDKIAGINCSSICKPYGEKEEPL